MQGGKIRLKLRKNAEEVVAVVHRQAAGMPVLFQVESTLVLPDVSMAVHRVIDIVVPHQLVAGTIALQVIGTEALLHLAHLQVKDIIVLHHVIK